jgi:hypothetical protein
MEEQLKDFIYSMANGEAAQSQEMLNTIMSQKVSAALDNLRVSVAQDMFNATEE